MNDTKWKQIDKAAALSGLSKEAILKSNALVHIPAIMKSENDLYVDFKELCEWIIDEGITCLERLVTDNGTLL